jgi:hypothetical protein
MESGTVERTRGAKSHGAASVSVRVIAAGLLAGGVGLIVWQVVDSASPDGTTISALLAAAVSVLALAYPRSFVSLGERISSVDAFGIKLDLKEKEAQLAALEFIYEDDGIVPPDPEFSSSNKRAMRKIAEELRRKLRFCSVAILGNRAQIPEEAIVENLAAEGLLLKGEPGLCELLLGDVHKRLDDLEESEREELLENAWGYAYRFASRTFDRHARHALTNAGWKVADFSQGRGHRRDFIAVRDGARALVAARVASSRAGPIDTGDRLAEVQFPLPELKRVVVVPNHADGLWNELDTGPMKVHERVMVMRLGQLIDDPALLERDLVGLTLATK